MTMRNLHANIRILVVIIVVTAGILLCSCTEGPAPFTGHETDGYRLDVVEDRVYLTFLGDEDYDRELDGLNPEWGARYLRFDSLQAMRDGIMNGTLTFSERVIVSGRFPEDENGIRIFNPNELYHLKGIDGRLDGKVQCYGASYSFDGETVSGNRNRVFPEDMYDEMYRAYSNVEGQTPTAQSHTDTRDADVFYFKATGRKVIRYTLEGKGKTLLVEETYYSYQPDPERDDYFLSVPNEVSVFGKQDGYGFYLRLDEWEDRPTVTELFRIGLDLMS